MMKLKAKKEEENEITKKMLYTEKIDFLVKKAILEITNNGKIYWFTIKRIRYNLNISSKERSKINFIVNTMKNLEKLGVIKRINSKRFDLIDPKYLIKDLKKPR